MSGKEKDLAKADKKESVMEDPTDESPSDKTSRNGEVAEEKRKRVFTCAEIGHMIDFGLGRGVDASEQFPWRDKTSFQVREVNEYNIFGTEEGGVKQSYSHVLTSVQELQAEMSASVPVSKAVSVSVGAEFYRGISVKKRSVGQKVITRTISYKADSEDVTECDSFSEKARRDAEGHVKGGDVAVTWSSSLPTFEQRLAKWVYENMQDDGKLPEEPNEVLDFFKKWAEKKEKDKDLKEKLVEKCHQFIKLFHITHYVSSLTLGASIHRVMTEEEHQTQAGINGSVGVEKLANMAVGVKTKFNKNFAVSKRTCVGHITGDDRVKRGTIDEAVLDTKFQPISVLVKTKILKESLIEAIEKYLDTKEHSKAGPFFISCHDERVFLKVDEDFKVKATADIDKAAEFFIIFDEDGYDFNIMHVKDSPLKEFCIKGKGKEAESAPRYLYASTKGPLSLRLDAKERKTRLYLRSRREHSHHHVDPDWTSSLDIFYIYYKRRHVMRNSYICVKKKMPEVQRADQYTTCCVHTHQEDDDSYKLFRLIRVTRIKKKGGGAGDGSRGGSGGAEEQSEEKKQDVAKE